MKDALGTIWVQKKHAGNSEEENNGYVVFKSNISWEIWLVIRGECVATVLSSAGFWADIVKDDVHSFTSTSDISLTSKRKQSCKNTCKTLSYTVLTELSSVFPATEQETSYLQTNTMLLLLVSVSGLKSDKWLMFTFFVRIKHANRDLLDLKYFTASLI